MEKMWQNVKENEFVIEHDTYSSINKLFKVTNIYKGKDVEKLRTVKLIQINTQFSQDREKIISLSGVKIMGDNVVILRGQKEYYIDTKVAIRRYQRRFQGKINVLKDISKIIKRG